jgi:hypothetical protein
VERVEPFSDLSVTKNENFKISYLLKSVTDDDSEFNVSLVSTEVLLSRLRMSFSVVIDFLIDRLILFLQDNSGAHCECRCQVFVIWAGFFDWAHFKGFIFIFEVSRVYGRRLVHVESTAD